MEKKQLNIDIGQRIREERNRANMSREKLAELVDVTPRFIADIERGSVGLSVPTLKSICENLNISADKIIWGNNAGIEIDKRLQLLNPSYIEIIDKIIQNELELIKQVEHNKLD